MTPQPKTGVIYRDDNLDRLRKLDAECVDLIYLDPPFFSNRHYEIIWGDESEIRSFKDRWKGGIDHYIGWMKPRLEELHRVLKPEGSIYLHCDYHASHRLRVLMDEIFGPRNFCNEIIWHYRKWSTGRRQFQRNHDVLLFYSRSPSKDRTFNDLYMERAASTVKRFGKSKIISGHDQEGRRVPSQTADEASVGVRMDDVWDIGRVPPIKQLFPTQKPEPLLERIMRASTNKGDLVLDPFCGCGTTLVVAHRLQRDWIGIDISPTAIDVMQERLSKIGAAAEIVNGISTVDDLRTLEPFEFQNFIIKRVYGTHNPKRPELGIDGFSFMEKLPIEVKQQDHVGRPVVDRFETAIRRYGSHKGYIIAFNFTSGAYAEAARIRAEG
jgi:DNA modification methylase